MTPNELSLAELEAIRATGRWDGCENSEIEYELHGMFDSFTSLVGVDDRSEEKAVAQFVVLGDGQELWRSEVLKRGDNPQTAQVKIAGVRKLTLKTTDLGHPAERGQVDWIESKVARASR